MIELLKRFKIIKSIFYMIYSILLILLGLSAYFCLVLNSYVLIPI